MQGKLLVLGLLLILDIWGVNCKPNKNGHGDTEENEDSRGVNSIHEIDPIGHLMKFGFLDENEKNDREKLSLSIKKYQSFYGLEPTGVMNDETIADMETPRCGIPDIVPSNITRAKRYALIAKWRSNLLSWRLRVAGRKLTRTQTENIITRAFKVWTDNSGLRMAMTRNRGDIEIAFFSGYHGDNDPFDGPGRVLAHAYFPQAGGDIHMDNDENWTDKSSRGINLFQVIAHEIGHSLGIGHSRNPEALMYAKYLGYSPNFYLPSDDRGAIQTLYGPPPEDQNTVAPPTRRTPFTRTHATRPGPTNRGPTLEPRHQAPRYCENGGRFDTIFSLWSYGETYAFEGEWYYRLDDKGIISGYPRRISQDFSSNMPTLNSAIVLTEDFREYIYIFSNGQIWKYYKNSQGFRLQNNFPKPVNDVFRGIPSDIDSGFRVRNSRSIYFFKGDEYYRSFPLRGDNGQYALATGYPRNRNVWNLPLRRIDGVFTWQGNGRIYFFEGNQYYRYNEIDLRVDSSKDPYPRGVRKWWLGCDDPSSIIDASNNQNSASLVLADHEVENSDIDMYNREIPDQVKKVLELDLERVVSAGGRVIWSTAAVLLPLISIISILIH